jgi:hypothetical protein
MKELLGEVFSMESVPRLYISRTSGTMTSERRLSRVEAGSNTSTVALRVVGGDEKGTQYVVVKLGHPVPGGYKYGELALQVGGFSNLRQ